MPSFFLIFVGSIFPLAAQSSRSTSTLDQIVGLLHAGRYQEVVARSKAALKRNPTEARLWTTLGVAYAQLQEPGPAKEAFYQAGKLDPSDLTVLEDAAQVSYKARLAGAEQDVLALVARDPDDSNGNAMMGVFAARRGDCQQAVAAFERGRSAVEHDSEALDRFGQCLLIQGNAKEAADIYRKELELSDIRPSTRYYLALSLLALKRYAEALEVVQPLIAQDDQSALLIEAKIDEAQGHLTSAVEILRHAIALNPHEVKNYLEIATVCFDTRSYRDGVKMLDFAIKENPDSAALRTARGILHVQLSEEGLAAVDFDEAARMDAQQTSQKEAHVLFALQRNDLSTAETQVEQELRGAPHDSALNYLAAQIIYKQGTDNRPDRLNRAVQYAEAAVTLDQTNFDARDLLAELYFEQHDYQKSIKQSRAALNINQFDQAAMYRLLLSLKRSGDPEHEAAELTHRLGQMHSESHELEQTGQEKLP
ncbi:TPR domain protein, putative component of TonB system [Acidisarcina polymorpha]|uniref:TPR domain protein, putative component of TonB system n=1 Tax=Acidisarcina polymorpha TaxID=2211140 RepID=A0A2Z5G544_9BACT|nr:CDC27 family protein [Acidisarcina polymorpha]AXC13954.1 TPR domain protein, putative component of TonB system [Acidisarcina polymorpha]